jgi:parvulin-like peptidyl-prolyl isomerase
VGAKSGRNKRGGRGRPKKATPQTGGRKGGGAAQRFGLILFAVVFVGLFVVFAVAEGLGAPSVPSGDIAKIDSAPEGLGNISEAEYKSTYKRQWTQAGLKKAPKAGSKKAEELHKASIEELLSKTWIFGEAEELGIEVTQKEVESELEKVKKESFKTEKAFQEFLKEQDLTEEEVNQLIELRIIQPKIQEKVSKEAPPVTEAEAEAKYKEEEATTYTKKPTRDVRVVVNENKKEVEEAQKALEADNSEASWKKVTKKYSPTTEANAGLQKEISEEFLTEPLKKDIFSAKPGELIGPVKQEKNYLLLEVVKLHPESVQPFSEVKTTITTTLTQEREQKYFNEWVTGFQSKWTSRTHCASGFVIENCANYKGSGRPSGAAASCYEANPKKPPTECPAPVTATSPAVPGSVTVAKPEGERKPQGPLAPKAAKEGKGKEGAEGAEGAAGAEEEGSAETQAETEAAVKAAEEAAAEAAEESSGEESSKESSGKKGE